MEQNNISVNNPSPITSNPVSQPQPPSLSTTSVKTESNTSKPAVLPLKSPTPTPSFITKPPRKINLTFIFFILLLLINLILVILITLNLPAYEKLKKQAFLEKTYQQKGLTKKKLTQMNQIFSAFADEKTVVQIVSEINKAQYLFENYSFSFESDIPKKEGASYLPFVIKVKGNKDTLFYLIDKLTSSKNIIEITDLQTGYDSFEPQKETESIINAKLYISENYSK